MKIDQAVVQEESQSAFNGLDLDGKVKDVFFCLDIISITLGETEIVNRKLHC